MRVEGLETYRVVSAACGQDHSVAVTDGEQLASWGAGEYGQLGQVTLTFFVRTGAPWTLCDLCWE